MPSPAMCASSRTCCTAPWPCRVASGSVPMISACPTRCWMKAAASPSSARWSRRCPPRWRPSTSRCRRSCRAIWRAISTRSSVPSCCVRWRRTASTAPLRPPAWGCRCDRFATAWRDWRSRQATTERIPSGFALLESAMRRAARRGRRASIQQRRGLAGCFGRWSQCPCGLSSARSVLIGQRRGFAARCWFSRIWFSHYR
mmetsp:Transcript_5905/g.14552  ORF Transcript_5905/g.14552 Transcript_5905/m.14552 type:complete len:200 (-) Transcript_5905:2834-3433(-)